MNRILATIALIISMTSTTDVVAQPQRAQSGKMARGSISEYIACNFSNLHALFGLQNGQFLPVETTIQSLTCALGDRPERQVPISGTHDTKPAPGGGTETVINTRDFGEIKLVIITDVEVKDIDMADNDKQKLAEFLLDASSVTMAAGGVVYLLAFSDISRVQALIASNVDVNAILADGTTALMIASANGHLDVVTALIEAKADVYPRLTDGTTVLQIASLNGHTNVVKALIEAKADVNVQRADGTTALYLASSNDHLDVVKALIEAKADVNAQRGGGFRLPIVASMVPPTLEAEGELLADQADVSTRKRNGATALMVASQNGYLSIVRHLLAAKADVNSTTDHGITALMQASRNRHLEVMRALLAAKADANAATDDGTTALIEASNEGHLDVVQALIAAGADVNASPANNGVCPLIAAFTTSHFDVVKALEEAGAGPLGHGSKGAVCSGVAAGLGAAPQTPPPSESPVQVGKPAPAFCSDPKLANPYLRAECPP